MPGQARAGGARGLSGLERLARALAGLGLGWVLELEERDPQFLAVQRVAEAHGPGAAAVLAALNALASYRMAMRGEEWWRCWAETVSRGPAPRGPLEAARAVEGFLRGCPGARPLLEQRVRRVWRAARGARGALETLMRRPEAVVLEGGSWLVEALAGALRQARTAKTVVFSAKMAYYAARQVLGRVPAPRDVEIPVDVRVACFLYSTRAVDHPGGYRALVRRPGPAQEAVRTLSELTGIPPLNLDTVFWLLGWIPRDVRDPRGRLEALRRVLGGEPPEGLARLVVEARPCR